METELGIEEYQECKRNIIFTPSSPRTEVEKKIPFCYAREGERVTSETDGDVICTIARDIIFDASSEIHVFRCGDFKDWNKEFRNKVAILNCVVDVEGEGILPLNCRKFEDYAFFMPYVLVGATGVRGFRESDAPLPIITKNRKISHVQYYHDQGFALSVSDSRRWCHELYINGYWRNVYDMAREVLTDLDGDWVIGQ